MLRAFLSFPFIHRNRTSQKEAVSDLSQSVPGAQHKLITYQHSVKTDLKQPKPGAALLLPVLVCPVGSEGNCGFSFLWNKVFLLVVTAFSSKGEKDLLYFALAEEFCFFTSQERLMGRLPWK